MTRKCQHWRGLLTSPCPRSVPGPRPKYNVNTLNSERGDLLIMPYLAQRARQPVRLRVRRVAVCFGRRRLTSASTNPTQCSSLTCKVLSTMLRSIPLLGFRELGRSAGMVCSSVRPGTYVRAEGMPYYSKQACVMLWSLNPCAPNKHMYGVSCSAAHGVAPLTSHKACSHGHLWRCAAASKAATSASFSAARRSAAASPSCASCSEQWSQIRPDSKAPLQRHFLLQATRYCPNLELCTGHTADSSQLVQDHRLIEGMQGNTCEHGHDMEQYFSAVTFASQLHPSLSPAGLAQQ